MAGGYLSGPLMGGNTATWQQAYGIKPIVHQTESAPPPVQGGGGGGTSTYGGGAAGGTGTSGYSGGGGYYGGGGGGGGGGSFSFNNTYTGPTMAPMPTMDFSGLVSGFGDLLSQAQQGDVPEPGLPTQKNNMELQALRESSAGWSQPLSGPGVNPALGQRIPPDESKKLAALQQARIY